MKNKSLWLKLGVMVIALSGVGLSCASATRFALNFQNNNNDTIIQSLWSNIARRIIPIHFVENGNDFGGFLYFANNPDSQEVEEGEYQSADMGGQIFNYKDIKISDGTTTYYIMDRNLGAISNDINDPDSYGLYYIWGNDQGFTAKDSAFLNATSGEWEVGDKGPCPGGYHVPSKGEWQGVHDIWCSTNDCSASDAGVKFGENLKIPFAESVYDIPSQNRFGFYWSSSKCGIGACFFDIEPSVIRVTDTEHSFMNYATLEAGLPVRCFKDSSTESSTSEGGEGGESSEEPEDSGEVYYVSVNSNDKETGDRECKRQLKGFYYNAERGDRLWPIDEETLSQFKGKDLIESLEGGIYTLCRPKGYNDAIQDCKDKYGTDEELGGEGWGEGGEGGEEGDFAGDYESCVRDADEKYPQDYAYYGMVTWTMTDEYGGDTFVLAAGTKYGGGSTWLSTTNYLIPNFTRYDNRFPIGFVYDYNGGVGFAGCEIKASNKNTVLRSLVGVQTELTKHFYREGNVLKYEGGSEVVDCEKVGISGDSLIKLIIEGLVGVNRESDLGVLQSQADPKMQYFSSSDVNSSVLMNYAKQKSEIMCRGKWMGFDNLANNLNKINGDVVCLKGNGNNALSASLAKSVRDTGKTLVVKNADVIINPEESVPADDTYYDMFINNGNLYINETGNPNFVFTEEGFVLGSGSVAIQNFKNAVSVLETPGETYGGSAGVAVGSYIKGNFIVDGSVKGRKTTNLQDGKLHNKYVIHGKFSSKDSYKDLEKMFVWRCTNGYVLNTDKQPDENQGRYCPPSVFEDASLVVIDQNYDSPLYW